jgi:hypothetical protein
VRAASPDPAGPVLAGDLHSENGPYADCINAAPLPMTPTLTTLLQRREHRLQLNLTDQEVGQLDQLASAAGATSRAAMARALVLDSLMRHSQTAA